MQLKIYFFLEGSPSNSTRIELMKTKRDYLLLFTATNPSLSLVKQYFYIDLEETRLGRELFV